MKKQNEMLLFEDLEKSATKFHCSYSWSDMANELQAMGFAWEEIRELPDTLMFLVMRRPIINLFKLDDVCKKKFWNYKNDMSLKDCLEANFKTEQVKKICYYAGLEK